jgi:hypothetical protein
MATFILFELKTKNILKCLKEGFTGLDTATIQGNHPNFTLHAFSITYKGQVISALTVELSVQVMGPQKARCLIVYIPHLANMVTFNKRGLGKLLFLWAMEKVKLHLFF